VTDATPTPPRLRWRKLSDEVAETLRRMILTGELTPGARTTQDELARQLGVSAMPIREALLRLNTEGFVHASPNKSFTITRTTTDDIADIYWMHATLAGELTWRACARQDPELVKILHGLAEACETAHASGDAGAMETTNWRFHREINHAAGAPKLLLMLRASLRFIPEGFYRLVPDWPAASSAGHAEILDAFDRGDAQAAKTAAENHVHQAGALLAEFFTSTGYWTHPKENA
jgi:DNA-binding GntR family transcriptional regulator